LVGPADFWLLKIIRNTRKALLLAELRNITSQQKLPITPGKPQAATQAKYAFAPPAPYLPVSGYFRTRYFGICNFESKKHPQKMCNVCDRKKFFILPIILKRKNVQYLLIPFNI